MNTIIASCVIRNRVVYKNGHRVFENKNTGIPDFFLSVYQFFALDYPRFYKMDHLSKLGWLGSEVLLKDSSGLENYLPEERGIILANANSSLDTDQQYFESVKEIPSPSLFVYTLPNMMIGEISIKNNFKGESAFFISPEFDPVFMQGYVDRLLTDHILKIAICGWVDLFDEKEEAILFLVEKANEVSSFAFTKENINKSSNLYKQY